jgi:hypothetical protein
VVAEWLVCCAVEKIGKVKGPRCKTGTRGAPIPPTHYPLFSTHCRGEIALLRHQNQPPDGSMPLMRRYVTRFP